MADGKSLGEEVAANDAFVKKLKEQGASDEEIAMALRAVQRIHAEVDKGKKQVQAVGV